MINLQECRIFHMYKTEPQADTADVDEDYDMRSDDESVSLIFLCLL